jgi:hypothetical protein
MTKLKKAHRTQYHRTFTPLLLGLGSTKGEIHLHPRLPYSHKANALSSPTASPWHDDGGGRAMQSGHSIEVLVPIMQARGQGRAGDSHDPLGVHRGWLPGDEMHPWHQRTERGRADVHGNMDPDTDELSQRRLDPLNVPLYFGFFEFVHNVRRRGKALLGSLIELLISKDPGIQ